MKKLLILLTILSIITPVYAVDYVYEAARTLRSCRATGKDCAAFQKYANDGIYYYSSRKNNSYDNLKNYCTLLGFRAMPPTTRTNEQWQKDMFDLKRYCGAFGF